jgi:hypothetical protein
LKTHVGFGFKLQTYKITQLPNWLMLIEIILEAWTALKRNLTRSFLTMLGIVWGIATVTLLIAYGSSFPQHSGAWLRRLRQERGDLLAAANQRAARWATRGKKSGDRGG